MKAFTPMLLQYLVGLCCMRADPEAVEVTLGDLVHDPAAGKARDVDVTVTLREPGGSLRAFKASEVKKESRPLDVAVVEQLSAKFADMTSITHKAIVSASGFTSAAVAKAKAHGVELFEFRPWQPAPGLVVPSFSTGALPLQVESWHSALLCWTDWKIWLFAHDAPSPFAWTAADPVLDSRGQPHDRFRTMETFTSHILQASTDILLRALDPGTVIPAFPAAPLQVGELRRTRLETRHTHTLDVARDAAYLKIGLGLVQVQSVSITGALEWQTRLTLPQFYVLEQIPDGSPFAGAVIAEYGTSDGRMCALTFAPNSTSVGVHPSIELREEHKHAIRQFSLRSVPSTA